MNVSKLKVPISLFIILFIAVSSAGAAIQLKPATVAKADAGSVPTYTAYNDCVHESGDADTNITALPCWKNGSTTLVNYADGTATPVTVTVTLKYGTPLFSDNDGAGDIPASGTDAYNTFNGFVDLNGTIEFLYTNNTITLKFSGLDVNRAYTFATTAVDSDSDSHAATHFVISGVTSADNDSTPGATITTKTITGDTTSFSGKNNTQGYVARWTNIVPASDGTFSVTVSGSGGITNGPSAFLLQEKVYYLYFPPILTQAEG